MTRKVDSVVIRTLADVVKYSASCNRASPYGWRPDDLAKRRALREQFYADLGRAVPYSVLHMPSYVSAVVKHWGLKHRNSARRLLAQIEGFESWEAMMCPSEIRDAEDLFKVTKTS